MVGVVGACGGGFYFLANCPGFPDGSNLAAGEWSCGRLWWAEPGMGLCAGPPVVFMAAGGHGGKEMADRPWWFDFDSVLVVAGLQPTEGDDDDVV